MITIREMKETDTDAVFAMMRVFYDSPAVEHTSSDAVLRRDIADAVGSCPLLQGFVFEEENGSLAGYAMAAQCYTTEYGGLCVWVEDLYILPAYRHGGLSGRMFDYIEQYYPEAVRFKLEVEQENIHAVAAYKKRGYQISPYFEMTLEKTEG